MKDPRTISNVTSQEALEVLKEVQARREWNRLRREKAHAAVNCKHCGALFFAKRQWQVFCSKSCRALDFEENAKKEIDLLTATNAALEAENARLLKLLSEKD